MMVTTVVVMEHVYDQPISVTDITPAVMDLMKLTAVSDYVANNCDN